ncbi:polysaccharide biosynthesis protein [Leptospira inadai serovar Lyme str. 10]|uniref:Polysaccharide biosynthesis protein n=2 Tax=Leptospira inadai serovar Lyme TaxID=293084 RepID=V6HV32_9LEPT|nr:flippase [Leptospira inadai]EQA36674.1 polysaccharide biosynthesis protein [Leptospira inadai serovar Lyme str. 10]PNV75819.1 flippase [Leptospira inadai serovar Lyme]
MLKPYREFLKSHPAFGRILTNSGWLFFDRIVRMGGALVIGIWMARYLGPESYGSLNFVLAIIALVGSIANLGMDSIIVRDLLADQKNREEIIGTSFGLQLIAGIFGYAISIFVIYYLRPNSPQIELMTWILGFSLVVRCWSVIKYWFEAQVYSKHIVLVENIIFLASGAAKITAILYDLGIFYLVVILFIENIATTVGYFLLYKLNHGRLSVWSGKWYRAKSILRDCWQLLLSNIAILIYMRMDQIMIGQMLDDRAVGIYTSAVRISEVWYFIPLIIVSSVYPSIIKAKEQNTDSYYEQLRTLHIVLLFLSLAIAILLSFLADPLIKFLYGLSYSEAGAILSIHIWTSVFVFLGIASGRWFILENLQRFQLYQSLAGCSANLVLNYLLIPKYGILGAAVSTLISQALASTFFNVLNERSRFAFIMQIEAFLFWRSSLIKNFFSLSRPQ